jgi:hypothetical protein
MLCIPDRNTYFSAALRVLLLAFSLIHPVAQAASLQCLLGTTRCIKSQGKEIPAKQVAEMLDRCEDFTSNDIGRTALRLSYKEISERSGGMLTPLVKAWHAYGDLHNSPLPFKRNSQADESTYFEIKKNCEQLERDFYSGIKRTQ